MSTLIFDNVREIDLSESVHKQDEYTTYTITLDLEGMDRNVSIEINSRKSVKELFGEDAADKLK